MRRTVLAALLALVAPLLPAAPAAAAQYADVASVELASPALVSPSPGVLEVYTRAADGRPMMQVKDAEGRWSRATSLGGWITAKPAAVSMTPGRTDLFVRSGSGELLQKYVQNGVWSGWRNLGGRFVGAPTAVSWAPGRLDVFARGTDGALKHLYYPGGAWSGWASLGGVLHSEPAVASTADGALDILVRGGDGALRLKTYVRGRGWSAYSLVPGAVRSGPGATVVSGLTTVGAKDGAGRYVTRTRLADGTWTRWLPLGGVSVFSGLGAWVDLYDYQEAGAALSVGTALDDLRSRGVRTLYLQTARFSVAYDVAPNAAQWVDGAHARGMHVVGWYLPGYGDMARDLRRSLAIAELVTPGGGRFDAVGIDIEAHSGWGTNNEVPRETMNARAVELQGQIRARTNAALAAITPQPVATDDVGETWYGFPWKGVGASSDLVLPMAYWPKACHDACVRDYALTNARDAAAWSGRPVHIAGRGYPAADGTQVTDSDISAFVDGALAAGVRGGSVYDYASTRTRTSWWPILARLNRL